ncbi:hypothetical protein DPMN_109772 [Dreissena polymorpha]|uniref:Uncharacterized protein n=1 Tax=Dreissena polymorpha TaxID=45954 RepID=A0A9D4QN94_DREPO|nr:hypothetical protein DPMN_109772 [Dreissena polymorpha]
MLVWHGHIEVHDSYLIKDHKPGAVRSMLLTIRAYLKWCKDTRQASEHTLDEADRMLTGCLTATRQEVPHSHPQRSASQPPAKKCLTATHQEVPHSHPSRSAS